MQISVLGATGSIGQSTLDLVRQHPDQFVVRGLTAHRDVQGMLALIQAHRPALVAMGDANAAKDLESACRAARLVDTEILAGEDGLQAVGD